MLALAGTDQFCQDRDHGRAADDLIENRVRLVRRFDAANPRDLRLEVVNVGVLR
jgi:hypothetical protein